MIEEEIKITGNTSEAQKSFEDLGKVIAEQKQITIEFEKELLNLEQQLVATGNADWNPKGDALKKKIVGIKEAIKDQRVALKDLNGQRTKAKKNQDDYTKGLSKTSGVVKVLNKLTGGLAGELLMVGKAAMKGGKAMRVALISSGIGAAVALIALIVQYWDQISGLVDGVSSEQEKQLQSTKDTLATQQEALSTTSQMENSLKLQGKTEKEIRDIKRQQTDEIIASTELLLEQQKQQKKAQIEAAERNQNITKGIIAFLTAPIVVLLGLIDGITNSLSTLGILDEGTKLTEGFLELSSSLLFDPEAVAESGDETISATEETLRKLKNKRDGFLLQDKKDQKEKTKENNDAEIKAEKEKAAAIERIRKGLIDTEAEERSEKLRKIKEDYDQQIALAAEFYGTNSFKILELKAAQKTALDAQQDEFDAIDKDKEDKKDKEKAAKDKKRSDKEIEEAKKVAEAKERVQDASLKAVSGGINLLKQLGEKSKGLQATALIGESAVGIAEMVINKSKADLVAQPLLSNPATATAGATALLLNKINLGIGIATNVAATAKGLAALGKGGAGAGAGATGGEGGGPAAPEFNLVEGSESNAIQESIQGGNEPIKAVVISGDVTTAQQVDRNIVEGSGL